MVILLACLYFEPRVSRPRKVDSTSISFAKKLPLSFTNKFTSVLLVIFISISFVLGFHNSLFGSGTAVDGDAVQTDISSMDRGCAVPSSSNRDEVSRLPVPPINAWKKRCNKGSQLPALYHPPNILTSMSQEKDLIPLKNVPPIRYGDAQLITISEARTDTINDKRYFEGGGRLAPAKPSRKLVLDVEDLDIPWNDLVLKERIGAGNPSLLVSSHFYGVSSVFYFAVCQ